MRGAWRGYALVGIRPPPRGPSIGQRPLQKWQGRRGGEGGGKRARNLNTCMDL